MNAGYIRHIATLILPALLCWLPVRESFAQAADHRNFRLPHSFSSIGDTASIQKELNEIATFSENYPDSARPLIVTAYQKSHVLSYQLGMGFALNMLGRLDQNAGAYDASIRNLQQAIPHLAKAGAHASIAVPYINIGNAYFYKGDYGAALRNYYRALNTMESHGRMVNPADSAQAFLNIAFIWDKIGGLPQATAALKHAEAISYLYKDSFLLVQFYGNAAKIYTRDSTPLALHYFKKAIAVAKVKKLNSELLGALNSMASVFNFLDRPDSAVTYLDQTKAILDRYPGAYNYHRLHYRNQLAHALLLKKSYQAAEGIMVPLYRELQTEGLSDMLMALEKNMVTLYRATGREKLALPHAENYANQVQALYEQKNSEVTELWLQLLGEENNKALVTKELRISQQQHTIQQKNFWILMAAISLILLITVMLAFIRAYKQKQRVQQATIIQLQQEQEIRQLKAQIAGEEQERNRIAIELHDNVGGLLTTASYSMQTLDRLQPFEDRLQKIDAIIKEVSHEIRNTSHRLMPDALMRQSLEDATLQYCAFIERNTGLHIDTQIQGNFDPIPQDIRLAYFRILQELLQNVLKHAHAERVLVQLHASRDIISLTVEDDGIGFDAHTDQAMGKGFKNIENRVRVLNGHMNYATTRDKGTSVYIEVSLADINDEQKK